MKILSAPFELTAVQKNAIGSRVEKFFRDNNFDYADQVDLKKPWFPFFSPRCCGSIMLRVMAYESANTCCKEHTKYERCITSIYVCACSGCDNIGTYYRTNVDSDY